MPSARSSAYFWRSASLLFQDTRGLREFSSAVSAATSLSVSAWCGASDPGVVVGLGRAWAVGASRSWRSMESG